MSDRCAEIERRAAAVLHAYERRQKSQLSEAMRRLRLAFNGAPARDPDPAWGLSEKEARVALALAERRSVAVMTMIALIYAGQQPPTSAVKNVYVFVHRIRRKLEPFGVRVLHTNRKGYFADADGRAVLRAGFGIEDDA